MFPLILCCWAAASWHFAAAVENSMQPPFSASLLYIYATDSAEWSGLTGKHLRSNDTLLIRPGVVYKVWCEVLPEGWPKIRSSIPNVIAYRPRPLNTMAHVELQRDVVSTLKATSKPAKLWCDYSDGDNKLQKIEVIMKPLIRANTTCDFSTASGLTVEGSSLNFTCTSSSGYPRPEHHCKIIRQGSGFRQAARVVSVSGVDTESVVTIFSVPATKDNQNASIQCSVQQKIEFESYTESFVEKVSTTGLSKFTFAFESAKSCMRILKGDFGVSIQCQSVGGFPETEHRCWKTDRVKEVDVVPLMAKIKDESYVTEMVFNNTWGDQGGSVTCVLQQGPFYTKRFSLRIPEFKQSVKSCQFSQLNTGGLQAKCFTGTGLPSSKHDCAVHTNDGRATVLQPNQAMTFNSTQTSIFLMPLNSLSPGSNVVCTLRQDGFDSAVFVHVVPKFSESRKMCVFTDSLWEVRATCEFSRGNPATRSDCQLVVANSSVKLTLQPEKAIISETTQLFTNSYLVRLPGPNASHAGGSIVCRVHQDALFPRTFVYRIAEYKPNATREVQELHVSNHTVLILSLALVVALLLILLLSLPVHALRRCLSRKRKGAGGALYTGGNEVESTVHLTQSSLKPPPHRTATQPPVLDLYDIVNFRRGGYRHRDAMPDIDQTSMFECGYAANLSKANKRKSVLADALVLCQADLDRRDYRFSV